MEKILIFLLALIPLGYLYYVLESMIPKLRRTRIKYFPRRKPANKGFKVICSVCSKSQTPLERSRIKSGSVKCAFLDQCPLQRERWLN